MKESLSVIVPSYNESSNIDTAVSRLESVLSSIPFEIIFVDDGSKDDTWQHICDAARKDSRVKGISFSRNFGKEAAIMAGLEAAKGGCCVTIDCDMQHPPETIPEMYALWQQGYEVIEGKKANRGNESGLHRLFARTFYRLMSAGAGFDMTDFSDFKLLDRNAVNVILSMREQSIFYRALSSWVGFKTAYISFEVAERSAGTSKWSVTRLIKYALSNMASFSNMPLHLPIFIGGIMLIVSLICGIIGASAGGINYWSILFPIFLTGGICMTATGVMGYYLGRIYDEVRMRPRYIVARRIGDDDEED